MTIQGDKCLRHGCDGTYVWRICKKCGGRKKETLQCSKCNTTTGFGREATTKRPTEGWISLK